MKKLYPKDFKKGYGEEMSEHKRTFGDLKKGGFLKKCSDIEVVKSSLIQLLLTAKGERLMLPNYGTNLRKYLMEPLDQATFTSIKKEIQQSIR